MAQHRAPRKHVGTWIVITVLLAAAVIGTLWVPFYNHLTPALKEFPFFYWYQLMWVFLSAILVSICYRLVSAEERKRRAAQGLGDPERPDSAGTAKEAGR